MDRQGHGLTHKKKSPPSSVTVPLRKMADISDHTLGHCCQGLARFTRQSGRHFIKNSAIDFWLNIGLKNGFLRVVFKLDMKIYKMESLILKFMKNCLTYLSNVEKILFHYFFLNFKAASPSIFCKQYFFPVQYF